MPSLLRRARHVLLWIAGLMTLSLLPASAQEMDSPAEFAVIYDVDADVVLFAKNGDQPMIPASMTKIMTAFLIFDRLQAGELTLDTEFVTSERAWREGGFASGSSTMGLEPGQRVSVQDLLKGMIVVSGNDAAIVLAEGVAGSEPAFAQEMTALAQSMGLESANFSNATGLYSDTQRISPVDLARLSADLIKTFPDFYTYYSIDSFTWNGIRQPNRNRLLANFPGADGIKTGHLSESGYGMVASAVQDGRRLVVVINGLGTEAARAQEAERLLRLGFTAFESRLVGQPGEKIVALPVALGNAREVGVTLKDQVRLTGLKRALRDAKTEVVFKGPVRAPITEGDKIADLVITVEGQEPVTAPLYATASVGEQGFFQKALDGFSYTLFGE